MLVSKVLIPNVFVNYWIISHTKSDLFRILQLSSVNQRSEDGKTNAPQVWSGSES